MNIFFEFSNILANFIEFHTVFKVNFQDIDTMYYNYFVFNYVIFISQDLLIFISQLKFHDIRHPQS